MSESTYPIHLVTLVVDMSPHPSLNVNDKGDDRAKTKHKDALRWATAGALQNVFVVDPVVELAMKRHALRFDFLFEWERYRRKADDDNLKGGPCKVIRDAICTKLVRDDADVATGEVEQDFTEERQGRVIVEVFATAELAALAAAHDICRAKTTRGYSCPGGNSHPVETDHGSIALCRRHRTVYDRRGGITLYDGSCVADGRWYADARVGVVS